METVTTMRYLLLPFTRRYVTYAGALVATILLLVLSFSDPLYWFPCGLAAMLALLGTHDLLQTRHSLLRNYPIVGHIRFILEEIRPEVRQYFAESDTDGLPFSRTERSLAYERAKTTVDKFPFGTELDVNSELFEWLDHSIAPKPVAAEQFRITVGGPGCLQPYSISVLNISAMSFGALGFKAILALNLGAKLGGFAHDTGEGGFTGYHRQHGGDIILQVGSGYFGCRNPNGSFSPERFAEQANEPQVKMIEIKLSQGAKPGHGGVLPAAKVSPEIAVARGVPIGRDCISPAWHSEFSTPRGLLEFIERLRRLALGKPVGFKLCVGHPGEFLGICKAMLETGIYPDFIVIDGAEGGTGAGPLEFLDHVGMPLREGLMFVHNALVGLNIRDHIKLGASGKIITSLRDGPGHGSGRRLVQLGARLHVRARLYPVAPLPHGPMSDRSCDAGPHQATRARCPAKSEPGRIFSSGDRLGAGRGGRCRWTRSPVRSQTLPYLETHHSRPAGNSRSNLPFP